MSSPKAAKLKEPFKVPKLNDDEVMIVGFHLATHKRAYFPLIKRLKDGSFEFDHPDQGVASVLLMQALGINDRDVFEGIFSQLSECIPGSATDLCLLNFALTMMKGMRPTNQVEAMLAAQMVAVHLATMASGGHFANAKTILERESAERMLTKLARTFPAQLEALSRYRSEGSRGQAGAGPTQRKRSSRQ